jgi:hypothetical protein
MLAALTLARLASVYDPPAQAQPPLIVSRNHEQVPTTVGICCSAAG